MNGDELKELIRYVIANNRTLQEQGKIPTAMAIEGESGLGKTSIAIQIAEELNLNFVKINLSQIEEIGDLVGVPKQEFLMMKITGQNAKGQDTGIKKWIPEKMIPYYIQDGWKPAGRDRTAYSKPEWIENADSARGGILLLDDYSRADMRFMQAIMEILDRQEYISWKLPEGWTILLTSNPDNGEYIVTPMDTAQKTRYTSTVLKWDADVWARWADDKKIDSRCINFILKNREIVTAGVNPRALTTFFNNITSIKDFSNKESLARIQLLAEGSIGPEAAQMFTTFIEQRMDKIIGPEEILTHDDTDYVIDKLKDAIKDGTNRRSDIASIISARVLNFAENFVKKNKATPLMMDRLKLLITEDRILSPDISLVLGKKLNASGKFDKLFEDSNVAVALMK